MIIVKNRLNAGWECHQKGDLDQAEAIYRSVALAHPGRADVWIYFGMVLNDQARYDEALAAYGRALSIDPENDSAWTNRGNTLGMLGQHRPAVECHRKALSLSPNSARAQTNLGVELLRSGELAQGWEAYEARLKTAIFSPPDCALPFWQGEDLAGKHLLIHGEQGLGDEIQTARYVEQISKQGGYVTLAADRKLQPLFASSFQNSGLAVRGQPLPSADYQTCGLSLPRHIGFGPSKRYLSPDIKKLTAWKADLCRFRGLKIGISWCGNPQNPMNVIRSIPLWQLLENLPDEQISIVSLQATHGVQDLNTLTSERKIYRPLEQNISNPNPLPIDEMAGLIASLDLVITCDSICAHLAPALGVETWLLLSKVPDWRWGLYGNRSPWYSSTKLFRQNRQGDWRDVLREVNRALVKKLSERSSDENGKTPTNLPMEDYLTGNTESKECRHGVLHYLSTDKYIGESLRQYGEFSEQEVDLFRQLIKPGDTVIEVGSNIGTHTVPLGKLVGSNGRVFAYEPQRFIFELLKLNVEINDLPQVSIHRMALGETEGNITVPVLDPSVSNNFGGVPLGKGEQGDVVPISMIDQLDLQRCTMIKADVEGMEASVIRGAEKTIQRLRPVLYLENDRREKSAELLNLVKQYGYKVYQHVPPLYNPRNYFRNPVNLFGNICSINILCVPENTNSPVADLQEIS